MSASASTAIRRVEHSKQDKKRSGKLRGNPARDDADTRVSKTLTYVLRHGAKDEGIFMRPDGFVCVKDLLASPKFGTLDFPTLESIVQNDSKQRYHLVFEPSLNAETSREVDSWWIRANQGHSLKQVKVDGRDILSASEIPMAVHGTNMKAWESISKQGLSRMKRNQIHMAQGIAGQNIISGMRRSAEIFIYIDVQKAIDAGYKFQLSANGVVLTEGNDFGYLPTEFFQRVERRVGRSERKPIPGWEGIPKDEDLIFTENSEQSPEAFETDVEEGQ